MSTLLGDVKGQIWDKLSQRRPIYVLTKIINTNLCVLETNMINNILKEKKPKSFAIRVSEKWELDKLDICSNQNDYWTCIFLLIKQT